MYHQFKTDSLIGLSHYFMHNSLTLVLDGAGCVHFSVIQYIKFKSGNDFMLLGSDFNLRAHKIQCTEFDLQKKKEDFVTQHKHFPSPYAWK